MKGVRDQFRSSKPLVRLLGALVPGNLDYGIAYNVVNRVVVLQWPVECYPAPRAWTGSLLEWAKAVAGWKLTPVPRSLNGRLAA